MLTQGDVIMRFIDTPDADQEVIVSVASSKSRPSSDGTATASSARRLIANRSSVSKWWFLPILGGVFTQAGGRWGRAEDSIS